MYAVGLTVYAVKYTLATRGRNREADVSDLLPETSRCIRLTLNDPKAARSSKLALPIAKGQERWRCRMAEVRNGGAPDDAKTEQGGYRIVKQTKSRWWEVLDPAGELVCLTVYRRGAREVVRRLSA
jgi:hypothetical protein